MLNVDITGLCWDVTKVLYLIAVVRFYLTLSILCLFPLLLQLPVTLQIQITNTKCKSVNKRWCIFNALAVNQVVEPQLPKQQLTMDVLQLYISSWFGFLIVCCGKVQKQEHLVWENVWVYFTLSPCYHKHCSSLYFSLLSTREL